MPSPMQLHGAGLGLRRVLTGPFAAQLPEQVDFIEVIPENWINVGGRYGKRLRTVTERYPVVAHGLSLSIGSPAPLDEHLLGQIKKFLDDHQVVFYSDHLSFCSDHGHLYDLMPMPFTAEAVSYVAARIRRVQEILERRIAMENISYYAAPAAEMREIDFINAVLEEADCDLLLDVNNIYVNGINHRYDAEEFLTSLPAERVTYFHVAGHFVEAEDLRVDTHAAPVCDPVWDLLAAAYRHFGAVPTTLERDFNIPPLEDLLVEVEHIARLQQEHGGERQPERHYG